MPLGSTTEKTPGPPPLAIDVLFFRRKSGLLLWAVIEMLPLKSHMFRVTA